MLYIFINRNLYAGTNGSGVYKIDPAADPTTAWTQTISGFRNQYPAINALYSTPSVASPLYAGLAALGGAEQLEALEVADSGGEPNDGYSGGYGGGIYTTTPVASSGAETWILVSNTLTQHTVYTLLKPILAQYTQELMAMEFLAAKMVEQIGHQLPTMD